MIVLDTNVISEVGSVRPNPRILEWVDFRAAAVTITALTIAELRYGIVRLPAGRRRDRLERSMGELLGRCSHRIESFDASAAAHYGSILAERERAGRPIGMIDAQIAAICRSLGATLATRSTKDFADTGIDVVDPWQA